MTLDEAIKHAEEVAEEKFDNAVCIMDKGKSDIALENAEECKRCAEEHRQLAEWLKDYKRLLERKPSVVNEIPKDYKYDTETKDFIVYRHKYTGDEIHIEKPTPLYRLKQKPKTMHCKDCKYFEYDSVAKVNGVPLIVAHEICNKWGDGCKTKEDGYCFLFEKKESEGKMIDCNGNDVTQAAKDFFDSLEEELIESKRQFENCDRCKQKFNKKIDKMRTEIKNIAFDSQEIDGEYGSFMVVYNDVIQIIDKYIKENE